MLKGSAASAPTVVIPSDFKACSVRGPMPGILPIGSGARNSFSCPAGTSTSPSGLPKSEAIFATTLHEAMPTEATSPSSFFTRVFILAAISLGLPKISHPVISRNASSRPPGSMAGVKSDNIAMNFSENSP